ncbi:hypothetical protein ACLOJK_038528 [Asimina triloba]
MPISIIRSYLNRSTRLALPSSDAFASQFFDFLLPRPRRTCWVRSKMSAPKSSAPKVEKCCRKSKKKRCGRRHQSSPLNARGVSDRLQALKELIPSAAAEMGSADQLFEETADYILFLRRQVQVLQGLVHFYSTKEEEEGCKS